jgi:hypothetical protein
VKVLMESWRKYLLVEADEKVKNRGDVAEGLLAAAATSRFRKGEASVTEDDVERELSELDSKGKDVLNTEKKLGKERTYKIKRKDGTTDTIKLAVILARVNFEDLMNPSKREHVRDLVKSVVKYANSKNMISQSMEFAMDGESTKVDVVADGVGDQKGTKVDVRILNDGKELPLGRISLKAGGTKQLGQIGKGWAAEGEKSSRGIRDLFKSLFNADIGDDLKEEYQEAIASQDREAIGNAIANVYEAAFDTINSMYERDDPDEFATFLKILAKGIKHEAVLEEEGVNLIHLDKGDFEQLDFSEIEKKFGDLDIDVEVDFDDPGGAYDENLPYLRIFNAASGKNLLSVRSKIRINDKNKLKEFRHYVQKEKGLIDLLKVAKE